MNKRTVNISSLVLLLSLLSLITTMCLYYLVPMHYVGIIAWWSDTFSLLNKQNVSGLKSVQFENGANFDAI